MKRFRDFIRLVFISPELLAGLLPFVAYVYAPGWADALLKPMGEGIGWGLGASALPLGMLAFNYKEGFDLLSLNGGKRVLIEWPGYVALKMRVLVAFAWCVVGATAGVAGTWMAIDGLHPQLAIAVLLAGLLASASATASLGLARFRLRELLGE